MTFKISIFNDLIDVCLEENRREKNSDEKSLVLLITKYPVCRNTLTRGIDSCIKTRFRRNSEDRREVYTKNVLHKCQQRSKFLEDFMKVVALLIEKVPAQLKQDDERPSCFVSSYSETEFTPFFRMLSWNYKYCCYPSPICTLH